VKVDEMGGQGHTSGSLFHQSAVFFILSVMDGKIEQRVCIKFRVKLSKSATETVEMLHDFGEHSLSQTAVFEWHSHFKAGQVSVEVDEHSG
jgi:hypothetical protein